MKEHQIFLGILAFIVFSAVVWVRENSVPWHYFLICGPILIFYIWYVLKQK
jgi:hypothetical protein